MERVTAISPGSPKQFGINARFDERAGESPVDSEPSDRYTAMNTRPADEALTYSSHFGRLSPYPGPRKCWTLNTGFLNGKCKECLRADNDQSGREIRCMFRTKIFTGLSIIVGVAQCWATGGAPEVNEQNAQSESSEAIMGDAA